MILCLDVGNTHIYGGVFENDKLILQFRYPSTHVSTSDQLGIFFRQVLTENNIHYSKITDVSVGSVVPSLDYSIRSAIVKYFNIEPFFLKAGAKTGLKISVKNPLELGADRIANSIAAVHQFSDSHIIVVDLGTATTFDIVKKGNEYLGGIIMPGIKISMTALTENTAKLPPVNIVRPEKVVGQTSITNIQSGLYYGHLGSIVGIINQVTQEVFGGITPIILGTGGFSHLFDKEYIFTAIVPELVLFGLKLTIEKNKDHSL